MPSGGARARSGPPPDPNALRRDRDAGDWTILPADGRPGPTPEWPLPDPTVREEELWEGLWAKPQAIVWERNGQELEAALYVRRFTEAERGDSPVTLTTAVRQMADSLGLTVPGMRANRWRIAPAEAPSAPAATGPARAAVADTGRRSARSRFQVVSGDGE
ncbi:hypothetical protein [Kitasatospora cineracea]|uniref:Uncharacterized protein n=1 Tax=Kitasatospora cineracea TaxID=88074 RepID=A0A3N4R176_9ACTN|nr:hypothetical protein [Kitasatospora cineracea]RPE27293.1 hypothetical protein EDD38_7438 [Kitasatospora cineracea]